jgi:hypothetical protein
MRHSGVTPSLAIGRSYHPCGLETMQTSVHIALAAIIFAWQGCAAITSDSQATNNTVECPAGQHALSSSCAWDTVVDTIRTTVQTETLTPLNGGAPQTKPLAGCYTMSADPVSVHTNQALSWMNTTSATITLTQSGGIPLATLAPGETSRGVYWSSAGGIAYSLSTCTGGVAAKASQIIVTVA